MPHHDTPFPCRDFVTIDDFKTKIVESLEDYDAKIDKLKNQMNEYTEVPFEVGSCVRWI